MRSTKTIDEEIKKLADTTVELAKKREMVLADLDKAKAIREQFSLEALAENDPDAISKLDSARTAHITLTLTVEDLDAAIARANVKIRELELEKETAARIDALERFKVVGAEAITQATQLDEMFSALGAVLVAHDEKLRALTDLSNRIGKPKLYRSSHTRRSLENCLSKFLPREFSRYKELDPDVDYTGFMRRRLGEIADDDVDIEERETA